MQKLIAASLLIATAAAEFPGCYKKTATRGVGHPIDACPVGHVQDGLLCYPTCQAGFDGIGPVCWEKCPAGMLDTGAFCQAEITSGDNAACHWYDKCGLTFDRGCVKCPAGRRTEGCLCYSGRTFAKKSYGRGAGKPLTCPQGQDYDAGLCYPPCPAGLKGVGPVCWGSCPAAEPHSCGAMCVADSKACASEVKSVANTLFALIEDSMACKAHIVQKCNAKTFIEQIAVLMHDFIMPVCKA